MNPDTLLQKARSSKLLEKATTVMFLHVVHGQSRDPSLDSICEINLMQHMISLQLLFTCFWRGLAERFGFRKGCQRHLKSGCKTQLMFYMILHDLGNHFGCPLRLRMG